MTLICEGLCHLRTAPDGLILQLDGFPSLPHFRREMREDGVLAKIL
jgi:hypothetical protein